MSWRRIATLTASVAGTAFVFASSAGAAHHLVRISEVYPGSTTNTMSEYVELQLTQANENQLFNQTAVRLYNATGGATGTATTATTTLANGQNQRYVLAGTAIAQTQFGEAPDLALSNADALDPAGGAVCFTSSAGFGTVDCMSWGTFAPAGGSQFLTDGGTGTGTPRPAIPNNFAAVRNAAHGCSQLLQTSDDSNNSANDFSANGPPDPQNNASPVTNTDCVLSVTVNGIGTVTGTGINCGTGTPNDCSQTFVNGEQDIVLTANTSGGSTFAGWSGCSSEAANQCTEDMNVSHFPLANFTGGSTSTPPPPPATDNSALCAELRAKVAKLSKRIKRAEDPDKKAALKKKRRKVRQQMAALGC